MKSSDHFVLVGSIANNKSGYNFCGFAKKNLKNSWYKLFLIVSRAKLSKVFKLVSPNPIKYLLHNYI